MINNLSKKTLAIFSLTCCEGCQFEILKSFDDFEKMQNLYEFSNFRLGQEDNVSGPYDVALVEGTPESEREIKLLKNIRKQSKTLVAIGSCAHMGGIQSERNWMPKKVFSKDHVQTVSDVVKVDYVVPGCPILHQEIYKCLIDIYWNKIFTLPDVGVCFECRENENVCLIKQGKPCLGPVTRAGCNSVCVNGGEMCLGCRGKLDQANFHKLREILGTMISDDEINNLLKIYGDIEK
jgi:coenzyme F420-reducing hydrogenase gamma subunit